jgi:hypothetical protein
MGFDPIYEGHQTMTGFYMCEPKFIPAFPEEEVCMLTAWELNLLLLNRKHGC